MVEQKKSLEFYWSIYSKRRHWIEKAAREKEWSKLDLCLFYGIPMVALNNLLKGIPIPTKSRKHLTEETTVIEILSKVHHFNEIKELLYKYQNLPEVEMASYGFLQVSNNVALDKEDNLIRHLYTIGLSYKEIGAYMGMDPSKISAYIKISKATRDDMFISSRQEIAKEINKLGGNGKLVETLTGVRTRELTPLLTPLKEKAQKTGFTAFAYKKAELRREIFEITVSMQNGKYLKLDEVAAVINERYNLNLDRYKVGKEVAYFYENEAKSPERQLYEVRQANMKGKRKKKTT